MPFEKGHTKVGGRKKGTPNKLNMRQIMESAVERMGGDAGLYRWARRSRANQKIFWAEMYMKMLAIEQAKGGGSSDVNVEVNVELSRDELIRRLEERGLPTTVFGIQKPILELTAAPSGGANGNGSDRTGNGQAGTD